MKPFIVVTATHAENAPGFDNDYAVNFEGVDVLVSTAEIVSAFACEESTENNMLQITLRSGAIYWCLGTVAHLAAALGCSDESICDDITLRDPIKFRAD